MNHFTPFLTAAVILLGGVSPSAGASPLMIDDFNSYTSGSYIQAQGGLNWSRFGNATSDGIYSAANGSDGGRAAVYQASFSPTGNRTNGYVRYTFAAEEDFSDFSAFSFDLKVNNVLPETLVYLQITSGGGTPTVMETLIGLSVTSTDFETYTFSFSDDAVRYIQGSLTVDEVLADLKSVTLRFYNPSDTGAQSFTFDRFQAIPSPIPEPASLVFLSGAAMALMGLRRRLKRECL